MLMCYPETLWLMHYWRGLPRKRPKLQLVGIKETSSSTFQADPLPSHRQVDNGSGQLKDPHFKKVIEFLDKGSVSSDDDHSKKIAAHQSQFSLVDGVPTMLTTSMRTLGELL